MVLLLHTCITCRDIAYKRNGITCYKKPQEIEYFEQIFYYYFTVSKKGCM